MKREIKNKSPEALALLRDRVIIHYVPRHQIGKALGLDRFEEERKKNLKKEEEKKEEDEAHSRTCDDLLKSMCI
jgi:hypothetical protein